MKKHAAVNTFILLICLSFAASSQELLTYTKLKGLSLMKNADNFDTAIRKCGFTFERSGTYNHDKFHSGKYYSYKKVTGNENQKTSQTVVYYDWIQKSGLLHYNTNTLTYSTDSKVFLTTVKSELLTLRFPEPKVTTTVNSIAFEYTLKNLIVTIGESNNPKLQSLEIKNIQQ